jgi:hypothetical protein
MENINFDESINSLKTHFFSVLEDFKKYYVYYHKNPEVNEFQNNYDNSKIQLQNISSDLLKITKNIYTHIKQLDEQMQDVSTQIKSKKDYNQELLSITQNLKNTENGSKILIDDSKNDYNIQYYYNLEILVGIFILTGLLVKTFKSSSQM